MTCPLIARFAAALLIGVPAAVALSACQTVAVQRTGFTAEQVALLTQEGFEETEDGWTLSFEDRLLFASDSATLNEQSGPAIERMARGLLTVGITTARVEGHSDSTGATTYNQTLSLNRAQSVARVMESHGFISSNLAVRGWGEDHPIADNATLDGRQRNRRVVIIVSAL